MPSSMFSSLESSPESWQRRGVAYLTGLLIQAGLVGAAIIVGLMFPNEMAVNARRYVTVFLPALTPPPQVAKAIHKPLPVVLPKVQAPKLPDLPARLTVDLRLPKAPPPTPQLTLNVPPPPPPALAESKPAPKAPEVHTGAFGGAPEPVTTHRPVDQVQTGGFGSPQGFRGQAHGESAGNVAKLGSFGLPDGPGVGNGTGGKHGIQGVVVSVGFGSGIASMGSTRERGERVSLGGFGKVEPASVTQQKIQPAPQPTDFQPVEIISKPSPVYTEEARRLRVQGEVALSVVFEANGAIRILQVVKSLGHGLDEAAAQAAAQIRFKPAQNSLKPVDFPATLRIEFRLADQNT
jgi:protein TonB